MGDNSESMNMSAKSPPPGDRTKAWLIITDVCDVFPGLFSLPDEEKECGPDLENCPRLVLWLAEKQGVPTDLPWKWRDILRHGGKGRLALSRSGDKVLLKFEVLEQNETGNIQVEVMPSLRFLRSEWERLTAKAPNYDTVEKEFLERFLDALPAASLLRVPTDAYTVTTDWIEAQFTGKGRPLAESHVYGTSEVFVVLCEESRLLVSYMPSPPVPILQEWMTWVRDHVPAAFASPLLSCATTPGTAPPGIVSVAIDDLFDTARLAEIQFDATDAEARLRNGFAEAGAEALGWYQPYHRYDEEHWGIYLHGPRVVDLGRALCDRLSAAGCPTPNDGFELAVRLVLEHELFHARMETFALGLELSGTAPIYLPYSERVYERTIRTDDALEEAIANFVAHERVDGFCAAWIKTRHWEQEHCRTVMEFIDELYNLSPPGYRNWSSAASPLVWRRLACQAAKGAVEVEGSLPPLEPILKSVSATVVELPQVAIFLAADAALADRFFSTPTRREVERLLKHRGYVPRPGKGSHVVWKSEDGGHFTLPSASSLSRLVFHNLLQHMGMSKEEYLVARNTL